MTCLTELRLRRAKPSMLLPSSRCYFRRCATISFLYCEPQIAFIGLVLLVLLPQLTAVLQRKTPSLHDPRHLPSPHPRRLPPPRRHRNATADCVGDIRQRRWCREPGTV